MLLFAYGTLQPDRAPAEIRPWISQFHLIGEGTVRGRLHHFATYPGLKLARTGDEIRGQLFELPDDPKLLAALDEYEEYSPGRRTNLFRRRATTVKMADGTAREAWLYEYAKRLPASPRKPVATSAPKRTKTATRARRAASASART